MKQQRKNPLWHRVRGAVDGYAMGLVRLIGERYGSTSIQQAWFEFSLGTPGSSLLAGDNPHTELFFSWLFHCWAPTREKGNTVEDDSLYGITPTRAYLDRHARRLNPLLCRYLETCLATSPAFYEVFNCKPCVGFQTRDLISGEVRLVNEELASTSLADGDIMFAHLIPIDEATLLEAISPLCFPQAAKRRLLRLFKRHALSQAASPALRGLYFTLVQPELTDSCTMSVPSTSLN